MTQKKKPVLRFKGFTDDWEQRKIFELFKITRGHVLASPLISDTKTGDKPYPVFSSQTKNNGLMGYYKDYLYQDAITWTTDGANAGTVNYRAEKFYCTNVCGVLLADKVIPNQMIAEALNKVAKRHVSYVGNPKLMNNVMADIEITLPDDENEQKRISYLFYKIDNLITLHQRKYEKLRNLKKFFLEKIFPQNGKRVPEVRFAGFTGDWEQRKLGEMLEFRNGFNGSSEIYGGDTPLISVMDILNNNFITHDKILAHVCVDNNIKERFKISYGDVLFQRSSENYEDAGTSNVYIDRQNNAIFGGFVIAGKKLKEYDPICFKYLLDSKYVRNQIIRKAQGAL